MTFQRTLLLGAIASCSLLASGLNARADYNFATTNGGTVQFGTPNPTTSTLILTGQTPSQQLNGQGFINIQDVEISTTRTQPGTDTAAAIPFTFTLAMSQIVGNGSTSAGSSTTTFSGTIQVTRSDVGNETSFLTALTNAPPIVIGNTSYTFSNATYTPPTVNANANSTSAGNISVLVTPTFTGGVPEPSSVILLGAGLVGVLGLGVRRSKKA